jgi:hypothetical protein
MTIHNDDDIFIPIEWLNDAEESIEDDIFSEEYDLLDTICDRIDTILKKENTNE